MTEEDDTLPAPKDLSAAGDLTVTRHDPQDKVVAAIKESWGSIWYPILTDMAGFSELASEVADQSDSLVLSGEALGQLKVELHDAYTLYSSLSLLYSRLSGGMISKPYTHMRHVLDEAQKHYEGWAAHDIVEELQALHDECETEQGKVDQHPEWYAGMAYAIERIKLCYPDAFSSDERTVPA